MKTALLKKLRHSAGFTMIELLVVIAIIGILAVAVLAAINPLEQIKRGSDTALKSDAEQMVNAVDRFIAFNNYLPWDLKTGTASPVSSVTRITPSWVVTSGSDTCPVVSILSDGKKADGTACNAVFGAAAELKPTYKSKVLGPQMGGSSDAKKGLFVYKQTVGVDTNQYVCFIPESNAFTLEAKNRCQNSSGDGLPTDLKTVASTICGCLAGTPTDCYVCLP